MISKKAIGLLKKNEEAKGRIAGATNRTGYTVNRWIYENDIMLTTAVVLDIIRDETGLTDDEILVKENAA